MKAMVCTKYAPPDVLQLKEIAKPIPKDNEVLIKIYAATATGGAVSFGDSKCMFCFGFPCEYILAS